MIMNTGPHDVNGYSKLYGWYHDSKIGKIAQALLNVAYKISVNLQVQTAQQELQSLFRKLSTPVVSACTYQCLRIEQPVTATVPCAVWPWCFPSTQHKTLRLQASIS